MQQISESNGELAAVSGVKGDVEAGRKPAKTTRPLMWRLIMNRYTPIAACLVLLALLIPTLMPTGTHATFAERATRKLVHPATTAVGSWRAWAPH
jgi:hypothetical protein